MRKPDWQADYEDEIREVSEVEGTEPAPNTVYLVVDCNWEYNDSFYDATEDGITQRAFRSREIALEHAIDLLGEGKISNYKIVDLTLQEGEG